MDILALPPDLTSRAAGLAAPKDRQMVGDYEVRVISRGSRWQ